MHLPYRLHGLTVPGQSRLVSIHLSPPRFRLRNFPPFFILYASYLMNSIYLFSFGTSRRVCVVHTDWRMRWNRVVLIFRCNFISLPCLSMAPSPTSFKQTDTDLCHPNPCANGSPCFNTLDPLGGPDYYCLCPSHWQGKNCSRYRTPPQPPTPTSTPSLRECTSIFCFLPPLLNSPFTWETVLALFNFDSSSARTFHP